MTSEWLVEEWDATQLHWPELQDAVAELGQEDWVAASYEWHRSSHILVALSEGAVAGFLRFVVQPIGPEADCDPVTLDGVELTEAKVLAFGVLEAQRRHGAGRALQEAALRRAAQLGCYQMRSHSSGSNSANHRLKLSMGFAVHPVLGDGDTRGVYFVMPLRGRA